MMSHRFLQAAAVAFAVAGFGVAAPEALAGDSCRTNRTEYRSYDNERHVYSRTSVGTHYGDSNFRVSFSVGNSSHDRHYGDRDRNYGHTSRDYGHHDRGYGNSHYNRNSVIKSHPVRTYHSPSSGYWSRQWVPAVYETRYYSCGTPYRVCVRAGYYTRVWVSTGRCR